jgi:subtilisin family serine protease
VAKNANIISVKVFNETQSGSLSGILDGFDWISNQTTRNVAEGRKVRNVINMSWGFHDPVWRYELVISCINICIYSTYILAVRARVTN